MIKYGINDIRLLSGGKNKFSLTNFKEKSKKRSFHGHNQGNYTAAGLGTRFLPYTKAIPKEMLPLLNKPAIQYIIEEGLGAAITNFF